MGVWAMLRIKRIYDAADDEDGLRVLIDRLWPRGLSKDAARVDLWLKEVAPSTELRKWFAHDSTKWAVFKQRYAAELQDQSEALSQLRTEMRKGRVTLLYGAKDETHNNAVVLKTLLEAGKSGN
jgi:uncharacterized protein YeaO (DUF488 family)